MMDELPPWFWIPAMVVLWVLFLVVEYRAAEPDPYDEPTGMDVLEKTGVHPHG